MFDTNFDKQKLAYHPDQVADWLSKGTTTGPIYTEMELTDRCNCRCIFCGVDYLVNKAGDTIETDLAHRIVCELHEIGNKSIMFCGHGEPLLHPEAADIITRACDLMSVSVTTNGLAMGQDSLHLVDGLEWIRFSINGCHAENYAEVHGVGAGAFEQVMANVSAVVERKRKLGLEVVIGSQLVLLEENAAEVVGLARRLKEMGLDYFSVKPYSQHPLSKHRRKVDYDHFEGLEAELASLADESYKVIYRKAGMAKAGAAKPYRVCYGTHFLCFVSANGDVWECNVFAGDSRFLIGNAAEQPLADIWNGGRRREVLAFMEHEMCIDDCRDICRMDECNRYLWRLKHPWHHDNFI